jgi:hypothetical protein
MKKNEKNCNLRKRIIFTSLFLAGPLTFYIKDDL